MLQSTSVLNFPTDTIHLLDCLLKVFAKSWKIPKHQGASSQDLHSTLWWVTAGCSAASSAATWWLLHQNVTPPGSFFLKVSPPDRAAVTPCSVLQTDNLSSKYLHSVSYVFLSSSFLFNFRVTFMLIRILSGYYSFDCGSIFLYTLLFYSWGQRHWNSTLVTCRFTAVCACKSIKLAVNQFK